MDFAARGGCKPLAVSIDTTFRLEGVEGDVESGEEWTIPFGGGFGRVFKVGKQPVNMQASAYWNAVKPTYGADWQLRLQVVFLFPK